MKQRHRFKQETSLSERLVGQANRCREQASRLPPGRQRDALLEKARQADTVAHLNDWISSPGEQQPKQARRHLGKIESKSSAQSPR